MRQTWQKQATGGRITGGEMYFRNRQYYNERRDMARATGTMTPYRRAPLARGTSMEARRMQAVARGRPRRVPGFPFKRKRRKRLTTNVAKSGAGSTFSRLVFGSKTVPKSLYALYKNNQEYIYEVLIPKRETSAFGKQAVDLLSRNDSNFLQSLMLTIPQLAAGPTIYQTGKFILQKTVSQMTFTNQDLATAYVQIYSIVPRFHVPAGQNPIALWDKGLEDQSATPGLNDDYRDVYAKPFSSQNFCLYYKVDKVTTFELQQGQSHCHETTYHINKEVHGQIVNAFAGIRGITKHNMIVVSGTPINDLANKTLISTSSCAVDIVEKVTTHYTYAASQRVVRTFVNGLNTITSAEIASIGAGIVVAEDEA